MYYIPAGILAKNNPVWAAQALTLGATNEGLAGLNWGTFVTRNLLPVTLGNIVGGALFVGLIYWVTYQFQSKKNLSAAMAKQAESTLKL